VRDRIGVCHSKSDTAAGVPAIVHFSSTATTKRLATMIAAVLFLFATTVPAAAACCLGKPGRTMSSMQMAMACCPDPCALSNPNDNRDHDVTLTPAPPAASSATAVASLVTHVPATLAAGAIPANDHLADGFSAPPPFLINSQFRI
jgi:hypothetical protein